MSPPTHLIRNFESEDRAHLYRKSDGMLIGVRKGNTVAWGEDPSCPQQRVFLGPGPAQSFLRKIADADQEESEKHPERWNPSSRAQLQEEDAEPRVISPGSLTGRRTN